MQGQHGSLRRLGAADNAIFHTHNSDGNVLIRVTETSALGGGGKAASCRPTSVRSGHKSATPQPHREANIPCHNLVEILQRIVSE